MSLRIGVLHGPNLNSLGTREPSIYGSMTLDQINAMISDAAESGGVGITTFQSNQEGDLVDWVQAETSEVSGWVVNAAGFTHSRR